MTLGLENRITKRLKLNFNFGETCKPSNLRDITFNFFPPPSFRDTSASGGQVAERFVTVPYERKILPNPPLEKEGTYEIATLSERKLAMTRLHLRRFATPKPAEDTQNCSANLKVRRFCGSKDPHYIYKVFFLYISQSRSNHSSNPVFFPGFSIRS